jgi:hypothetical protein
VDVFHFLAQEVEGVDVPGLSGEPDLVFLASIRVLSVGEEREEVCAAVPLKPGQDGVGCVGSKGVEDGGDGLVAERADGERAAGPVNQGPAAWCLSMGDFQAQRLSPRCRASGDG